MKFSQIAVGKTYVNKDVSREVVSISAKNNEITYMESGEKKKMPGQQFAKWAVTLYRDPSTRKPKEERRAQN